MTSTQAQRKAKKLFGPNAQAGPYQKEYVEIFLGESTKTWKGWPPRTLLGWGKTWDEAFAMAKEKAKEIKARQK